MTADCEELCFVEEFRYLGHVMTADCGELRFVEEFRYIGHVMTADCRNKDIKKQFGNTVGKMLVRKFSFAPMESKIQFFKSYCYPIYGGAHLRVSYQNSMRKLTVSYSDTFKRLINIPRYTNSSLTFAMNKTNRINLVFPKFAYILISKVTIAPNSIVTAIVNSYAYQHSH